MTCNGCGTKARHPYCHKCGTPFETSNVSLDYSHDLTIIWVRGRALGIRNQHLRHLPEGSFMIVEPGEILTTGRFNK